MSSNEWLYGLLAVAMFHAYGANALSLYAPATNAQKADTSKRRKFYRLNAFALCCALLAYVAFLSLPPLAGTATGTSLLVADCAFLYFAFAGRAGILLRRKKQKRP